MHESLTYALAIRRSENGRYDVLLIDEALKCQNALPVLQARSTHKFRTAENTAAGLCVPKRNGLRAEGIYRDNWKRACYDLPINCCFAPAMGTSLPCAMFSHSYGHHIGIAHLLYARHGGRYRHRHCSAYRFRRGYRARPCCDVSTAAPCPARLPSTARCRSD